MPQVSSRLAILSCFGWNCFIWVLILWGFCLFCFGFFVFCFLFFLNLCCGWKQIVIFGAEQLKLENITFQFLIIVLVKKCRKAAKLPLHWYSCELLIWLILLLLLVTCCVSPTLFFLYCLNFCCVKHFKCTDRWVVCVRIFLGVCVHASWNQVKYVNLTQKCLFAVYLFPRNRK